MPKIPSFSPRFGMRALRIPAAIVASFAMVVAMVTVTAPPAVAADPGVARLLGILGSGGDPTRNLATWTSGLGAVGKLGQPLPLVNASPGGLLGFDDLFAQAVTDELSGATTLGDLGVDKDISIGGGRTGHLTTTVANDGDGKRLDIEVTVAKHVTGQGLHVASDSPKVDLTVSDGVTVDVRARLALSVVWTGATDDRVYVVSGSDTPRLDVDATANVDSASAEGSVGILGVSLTAADLSVKAHLVGTVSDPDNDGRLFFDQAGPGDGELSQDGSLDGLVSVGLDPQGSQPIDDSDPGTRGSVHGTMTLGAAAASAGLDLPTDISATVGVDWADIGAGSPTVTAPGLADTVGKFANLSLKDLAAGLAQVVVGITAIQRAKFDPDGSGPLGPTGDLNLPFLRGKLSDAIQAGARLKDFLADNTVPAPGQPGFIEGVTDPAQAGQPTFTSLQDLLQKLAASAGISLSNLDWDADTSKLALTLGMTRTGSSVDLDQVSAAASGASASYGHDTLTVSGAGWTANQWVGRRVTAGTSAGEVASNTADTITLAADWAGGTPTDDTPYVISGSEPHVGAVTFADQVQNTGGQGILNANADQTFATVTPSFDTTVTLVLDLQDPVTGAACDGFEGNTQPCPFTKTDGAFNTQVDSLPLPTDRVMLRTGANLFHADFPIDTAVDLTANAGFFKVRLQGSLRVCSSALGATCPDGTPSQHMLSVGLKQIGDAQHDVRLSTLFALLADDPASLLDADVNVRAYADVAVSLPDAADFLPSGASASFTARWDDLTDPSTLSYDTSDLSEIFKLDFDPSNPDALFRLLVKSLQTLATSLAASDTSAGSSVFDKPIPGLGMSLRDLFASDETNGGDQVSYGASTLTDDSRSSTDHPFTSALVGRTVVVGTQVGVVSDVSSDGTTLTLAQPWGTRPAAGTPYAMRSALSDATDRLIALPPDNIQDAVKLLNQTLGTDAVQFRYLDTGGTGNLVLDVNWDRAYQVASPIRLSLGDLGGTDRTFAGAAASGNATVDVDGAVDVGLAIPLVAGDGPADATDLKVLEDSSISVHANATFNGVVQGVIGPLSIALGNPGGSERAVAKADVGVELAKSGAAADTPVSFSSFIGDVGVHFTGGTVDCGETLSTDLMVCAKLPMFLNASGASDGWTSIGDMALRLPSSTTPGDLFDFSGNLPSPDDGVAKFEYPTDLVARITSAVLDFGNLGDGLDAYLNRIEQALQLASFQGRLPLVGKDLQQGANFIGSLRQKLQNSIWSQLPGAGRPADAEEFKTFINGHLADALAAVNISTANLSVDFSCTDTLHQVAPAPVVTATMNPPADGDPTPASGTWSYKVVAYQGSGSGTAGDTVASAAGTATNYDNLELGSSNKLTWTAVDDASGYKILRKRPGDSTYQQIATSTGTTYTDSNAADTGTAYDDAAVTTEPQLSPCPLDFIDGVFLEFDVQQGKVSSDHGCQDVDASNKCLGGSKPVDIGIPGLALRQGAEGDSDGISYQLGWSLHLKLGLNKQDGFFISTHDGWGPDNKAHPELQVGFNFDLPDSMVAELAFIKVSADKAQGPGHDPSLPLFAGAFQVDLKGSAGEAGCFKDSDTACAPDDSSKIRFADLGSRPVGDMFAVSLTAAAHIDWILKAEVDSAMPGVRANFQLDWSFDNLDPDHFGAPTIAFKDVGISAGKFFEGMLGEVVKEIKKVTGPMQPVIDTLYAPIPVLSDLSRLAGGDDVTLVSLAKTFNTLAGGPKLDFVDTVKSVIEFLNRLPECDDSTPAGEQNCFVPLGQFSIDGAKALTTANTPSSAATMYKTKSPLSGDAVKNALNQANSRSTATTKPVFSTTAGNTGDADKSGFAFPILDHPSEAFNLLMGGDVDLVTFDSGPLTLGFSWRQDFGPVYAPPPVFVTMSGSASVTLHIKAGLDTYGLRKTVEAIEAGNRVDAVTALDGLYFATVDDQGRPLPVVSLDGEIAAGAAVSALIIEVGIEGGLHLNISFYWNDPNDDGKFRVSEFLHAALNNPLCLFTMSGRLSLFLRVYITIGVSIFSTTFSFTLADVTLLDFSVTPDCSPPPPRLGGTSGHTLVVYAGKLGGTSYRGDPTWSNTGTDYDGDTVKVIALHYAQTPADPTGVNADFDGFAVQMLGERRDYLDPGLTRVVVDGTGYGKPMVVTFTGDGKLSSDSGAGNAPTTFDKEAVVIGSDQGDKITTGTGPAYVDGRGGNDVIVTHDTGAGASKAWVAGGPGDDTITTGNGDDQVAGDATLGSATTTFDVTHNATDGGGTQSVTVFDWSQAKNPTTQADGTGPGADTIGVGLGSNTVRGNAGDDKIGVASDAPDGSLKAKSNTLVGDAGSDKISGGSAGDKIFTAAQDQFGVDAAGPVDTGATNVVDTGLGSDDVWGSTGVDLVTSHSTASQTATLRGGGNDDVLIGGYGTDAVYGGPGQDYVIAEPADVSGPGPDETINGKSYGPKRSVTRLPLPSGVSPNTKTLVGGLGNDHIVGGDGASTIFGDKRIDAETCQPGSPVTSDPVAESTSAGTGDGNDLVIGGAGVDTVSAGGGDDIARTLGGADLLCGQQGADQLFGGDDVDRLWGGTGADVLYGEAGNDLAFGNDGADVQYGGAGLDVLEGNDGPDWISGGADDDVVYGGTRAAGRPDTDTAGPGGSARGDDLYGDAGADIVIGDNGTVSAPYPLDLAGTSANAGAGDRIHGGADDDLAYGGLGDDRVHGDDGNDYLEGNNGSDTVHGDAGEDRIAGGSSEQAGAGAGRPDTGDFLYGDAGPDLIAGDNAVILSVPVAQATRVTLGRGFGATYQVTPLDLGSTPTAGTSGGDLISGGDGNDVALGQGGDDRVTGDAADDYAEGGPGTDWLEGDAGDDDLVGGSSTPLSGHGDATAGQPDGADEINGGPGDDTALGDNGQVLRLLDGDQPTRATVRLGSTPGQAMAPRIVQAYDLSNGDSLLTTPPAGRFGADRVSGGAGVDVLYGQDGGDFVSGGAGDDYVEGNGGADVLRGDLALDVPSDRFAVPPLADPGWPGSASGSALLTGATDPAGQDDLIGGTSTSGVRDGGDTIEGNGADDVLLGDNGTLLRTLQGDPGAQTERVYADRYPSGAVPADATRSRVHDGDRGDSTRFCSVTGTTCEPAGAFGDDHLYGDAGNDGLWGQDGDDQMSGGDGDDDMYGELGADTMAGDAGADAMLGDRGGITRSYLDDGDQPAPVTLSTKQPPMESYTGFRTDTVHVYADLLHDVDGDAFVGSGTAAPMPHAGLTEGGVDRMRGGTGNDNLHAGFGDDLVNGDSGGDVVFGDDGNDVLWGGRGCDPVLDAATPDCLTGGSFDPAARGTDDRFVDHTFGGQGDDVIDWNPRGSAPDNCAAGEQPVTTGSKKDAVTIDPCSWLEMTDKADADPANDQHHHGTDWIYGGWDRDAMQADVAGNGPNPGDRLFDWAGVYNLYSHCPAAYGGYNDIRLMAPGLLDFLTGLAWVDGAGQGADDVTTPGTSAYRELALAYTGDLHDHGTGSPYPGTPGHFDDPDACAG